jgi:hypothetical protein
MPDRYWDISQLEALRERAVEGKGRDDREAREYQTERRAPVVGQLVEVRYPHLRLTGMAAEASG